MVIEQVSRTVGHDQIVDEMIIRFNHTKYVDWMVPGIAPIGRAVIIPLVAIVRFEEDTHRKRNSE